MLLITSLIKLLESDFPQFIFKNSTSFSWSPSENTIHYNSSDKNSSILLLHEISHAILNHSNYQQDVELITMERNAWDKALELGIKYNVVISDDIIESTLDTYRSWLHERSTCPKCHANGIQEKKDSYKCIACGDRWRVNEARSCSLKRYQISQ